MLTGEHVIGMEGEKIQQLHLLGGKHEFPGSHRSLDSVEDQFSARKFRCLCASNNEFARQDSFDPRHEFVGVKRFYQVIIRPRSKPFSLSRLSPFPVNMMTGVFTSPDFLDNPTVHFRQHNIRRPDQEDSRKTVLIFYSILCNAHLYRFFLRISDQFTNIRIFNDQNAHWLFIPRSSFMLHAHFTFIVAPFYEGK